MTNNKYKYCGNTVKIYDIVAPLWHNFGASCFPYLYISQKMTPNFSFQESCCRCTGVFNMPPPKKNNYSSCSLFGLEIIVFRFPVELSPKFNCCKIEYLFILRFKGPLRFSMFRTRLSRKLVWPCIFLNGLRDFSCRAPFWRPCTFACVPVRFFQSVFVAPLQHGHSSRWERLQWTVCF